MSSYTTKLDYEDCSKSYSFNGPSNKHEAFADSGDRELKRKRRVASYNMFAVQRKLKSSVQESFKWVKNKFTGAI